MTLEELLFAYDNDSSASPEEYANLIRLAVYQEVNDRHGGNMQAAEAQLRMSLSRKEPVA